jgi:hypothetical protein
MRSRIGRFVVQAPLGMSLPGSESAPIPIPGHARAEALGGALGLLFKDAGDSGPPSAAHDGRGGGLRGLRVAMRALAVGAAGPSQLPGAVVDPAVLAGAAPRALGVVVGVLV